MSSVLPCCDFTPPPGVGRDTSEFSRLHREHHARTVNDPRPATVPAEVDLHHLYVAIDQLVAHAHDPDVLPDVTPGAQALLARAALNRNEGNPT
ncbi:MAG: hypothetical protein ACK4V6_11040 [Microthrixaceae bacterium]